MAKKKKLFDNYNYAQTFKYYAESDSTRGSWFYKIAVFVIVVASLTFFFSSHYDLESNSKIEYSSSPGYLWTGPKIVAEFNFPVYKNRARYNEEVELAKKKAPFCFVLNKSAERGAFKKLGIITATLISLCPDSAVKESPLIDESVIDAFKSANIRYCKQTIKKLSSILTAYLTKVYKRGFIDAPLENVTSDEIETRYGPDKAKYYQKAFLYDADKITNELEKQLSQNFDEDVVNLGVEILANVAEPNFLFSKELTEKSRALAAMSVPRHLGVVKKGEVIVSKGDVVDENVISKLSSYSRSKLIRSDVIFSFSALLGNALHSFIIYFLLILYLFFIRKRIFSDNFQFSLISSMLIVAGFISWLSAVIPSKLPLEYGIFIPALSILAAIVFDSRTAFYATVTMALIASGIRGNDYSLGLILLFAGALGAYTVRDIQNRSQMFQSILFVFVGFSIGIIGFSLERSGLLTDSLDAFLIAGMNSIISPILAFGALILLDKYSPITTDLKLLDYDKLSHPLLKRLNELAPGTYQHSLAVANLAERCAEEINANALLTKVGALYHDIGKTFKPDYFIENQTDDENKLDKLTPYQSAELIKKHVVEGIKLAHEYDLPQKIIDFIPTHHGTSLIKHFYNKALEEAEKPEEIDEKAFRYPGPKPFNKETAILMICDFSEALSRLKRESAEEYEEIIQQNIEDRLLDGQFDECDITIGELQTIKQTIAKSLLGTIHKRVEYKNAPPNSAKNRLISTDDEIADA